MSKASELLSLFESKIDDSNGLWGEFESKFPKVAKALAKGDFRDRFWDGIESVSEISAGGKKFLFVETPGHGWIVDMKGEVVGEEDDGFDDEDLNKDLKSVFKKKKELIR